MKMKEEIYTLPTSTTTKVTKKNVEELFDSPNGNLYYNIDGQENIVDGYSLKEVKQAMSNGVDFIFKEYYN